MSRAEAIMNALTEQFERLRDELPGSDAVRAQRNESFAQFARTGLPGRKLESWRYTDFSKLDAAAFDLSGGPAGVTRRPVADAGLDALLLPLAGKRIVFVDGRFAPALSSARRDEALELRPLAGNWAALAEGFPAQPRLASHPLALLNTAFTRDGLILRAPNGCKSDEPILIAFLGAGVSGSATQPRIVIDLGPHADVEIVLQFADAGHGKSWTNVVTEIRQADCSRLSLVRVQEHGSEETHTGLTTAALGRDAALELGCFELGGHIVRSDVDVKLEQPGAAVDLYGAFLALGEQHIDNEVLIEHVAGETRSRQAFRGIAGDRGHGVFSGKVVVHAQAQRIDARQRSDNLLLAKTAEIDARPALEIYADDVKCSHGATVGELDPQQLFYLQARGIGIEAARALLTFAFANTAVDRVGNDALRRLLIDRVASRLPAHERWEALVS